MGSLGNFWILPLLYRLVTNLDSNFDHAELGRNGGRQPAYIWRLNGERVLRQITALCEHSEICEGNRTVTIFSTTGQKY
jgi:hypothetical protein